MFTIRAGSKASTIARTILEDIEVAAVGQRLAPSAPSPGDKKGKKSSRREPVRAVTLLVKPEQVPTLHLAEQKGKIKLSMRGVADGSRAFQNVRVNEDDLLGMGEAEPERKLTWSEKFAEFVSSLGKSGEPQPELEEPPKPGALPVPDSGPKWAWVMAVQNGDERQMLGWRKMDDFRPTAIGSSGGRNIFEDPPKFPPQPPIIGSQPDPDREPVGEKGTESELEELFE
jgi:hypothetical protein